MYTVKDVDDEEDFKLTIKCMTNIGFTQEECDQVLDTTVAILLLGNLEFDNFVNKAAGDQAVVANTSLKILEQIAKLLQVD